MSITKDQRVFDYPRQSIYMFAALTVLAVSSCGNSDDTEATQLAQAPSKTASTQPTATKKAPAADTVPVDADTALKKYTADNLDAAFAAVAKSIAYEPYAGVQRGARGTALAGSGNAVDQALLLAKAVSGQVAAWRLAQGRLNSENLTTLLASVGPAYSGESTFSAEYAPYDPASDLQLQRAARDHVWLEVQKSEGDEWLALDPAYPGAKIGESFAAAKRHFDEPAAGLMQRLDLSFMQQTADGKTKRLGRAGGNVADLALYPIVLVARGIPQFEGKAPAPKSGDGLMGGGGLLGGGLGGAEPEAKPADDKERPVVGTEYRRELTYGGKEPEALVATTVSDANPSSQITREWIEFNLRGPGLSRKFRRDLYTAGSDSDRPATVRRYSITVVAGKVSRAVFEGYRAKLDRDQINNAKVQLAKLKDQPATNETALEILRLESAGALTPHLINLAFAFESDALTERMASGANITVVRDTPRVLITAVETGVDAGGSIHSKTTLDLRLDEVRAVPYAGVPVGAAPLFQRARGMQESALEGRVLARFVGDPGAVVTTATIMEQAQAQGQQLVAAEPKNRSALDGLEDLPADVAVRINAALDAGRQVIVPTAAAVIGGTHHWGWWDINPTTGAYVGVMQGGQHQAMTQYTVMLEEVGVNDAMGYVIGAIVGSTATMTLYAAKMLEYGQVTEDLIKEVAAGIKRLTCVTCPKYEVRVFSVSASASFESQCIKKTGVAIGTGIGVSGEISFCENYKLGISCAASLMLGTFEIKDDTSIKPNNVLDLGPLTCK